MSEQLLDTAEVARRLSCGRTHLHYMVKRKEFPEPMHIGRMRRWRVATVDDWIMRQSSREAAAQGEPEPTGNRETAGDAASPAPDGGRV